MEEDLSRFANIRHEISFLACHKYFMLVYVLQLSGPEDVWTFKRSDDNVYWPGTTRSSPSRRVELELRLPNTRHQWQRVFIVHSDLSLSLSLYLHGNNFPYSLDRVRPTANFFFFFGGPYFCDSASDDLLACTTVTPRLIKGYDTSDDRFMGT